MLRAMGASHKITHARRVLAANLLRRREALGVSQEAFAEKLGFHRTYISSVERCQRNVSVDNLDKMAKALRLKVADLLEE
jgi:transcriptional regulator with XRE-family HTH domain